jgi:hypothetical protein
LPLSSTGSNPSESKFKFIEAGLYHLLNTLVEIFSFKSEDRQTKLSEMILLRVLLSVAFATEVILSDLDSSVPEVRMRAAEMIRDNHLYKATPRAPWDHMTSTFNVGDSLDTIIARLHHFGVVPWADAKVFAHPGEWRVPLDQSWALDFTMGDSMLIKYKVVEEPKVVSVEPPPGYSGFWRTYRINGCLAHLYDYKNGRNLGDTLLMQ